MRGLSGATRVEKAALVLLALFVVGQSVGAVGNEWGNGASDNLEASGARTGQDELPGEPPAGDLTSAPEPPELQEGRSEELSAERGEEAEGPGGSLESRRFEQPIRPYNEPMSTPQGPAEGTAEEAMQQSTPEATQKQRGFLQKLRTWGAKAKAALRKAREALQERMRKAKETAKRGLAKLWARLPKLRRVRKPKGIFPSWFPPQMVYELSREDKAILEKLPEQCERYVAQLPPRLRKIWQSFPEFCALWTLFNRDGLLSTKKDQLVELAQELSDNLNAAKALDLEKQDFNALQLKIHQDVAQAEDRIANLRDIVDAACWFTNLEYIYERANEVEKKKLASLASVSAHQLNPCEMLKEAPGLFKLARKDVALCQAMVDEEIFHRSKLRATMGKRKAEALQVEVSSADDKAAAFLGEDLQRLNNREACSLVEAAIIREHSLSVLIWMEAYAQRRSPFPWRRRRAPRDDLRLLECGRPRRSADFIPPYFKKPCAVFQNSHRPTTPEEAAPGLAWIWEAASFRQEKAD